MIPLSVPIISGNEWKYVKDCLDTGWVSSVGRYVDKFEGAIAGYVDTEYAVATVNGTSALHVSLVACGVQANDEVIVPALTFIAPINVVRYCNAYPVFMDCDIETLCLDVQKVAGFIDSECEHRKDGYTYNKRTGRKIKALVPVHIFGHPVNMGPLIDICKKYNIIVIEDATESLGSEYKSKKTGSWGEIGCFSFNGNKIITTGGGGMVVTDDEALAYKIKHLTTQAKKDHPYEYEHNEIGYNYRLTNIQAAMGVAQMEKLDSFVAIKRKNAVLYRELLSETSEVEFIWEKPWAKSNFWFYTIKVPKEDKNPLIEYLSSRNIQARPIWKLIHTLPMYREFQTYFIEKAREAYDCCINLPCSISLKQENAEFVVENIRNYFSKSA